VPRGAKGIKLNTNIKTNKLNKTLNFQQIIEVAVTKNKQKID
jgi:hypothetical protein